jgi:O-antigen/teichoic acid export membrane protein
VTDAARIVPNRPPKTLREQVRSAVIWRSGTQIAGQMVAWVSTFLVIRILSPGDYGLFAMAQVVLGLLNMLNGYGLANALIQRADVDRRAKRQLFGMLIVLNFGLGALQFISAPLAAAYFRQPEVTQLLRVLSVLYLATPFIAFPYALLAREMDFRVQAAANFISALVGAATALTGALLGWGVWTLVAAPIALFTTRAIGMTIGARAWMWPSFDFRGAADMARYGGLMAAGQFFWFLQSQADVFIAGRFLDAHWLGLYTTSLFLTQILVAKFVPPINDVAFSAYARIHNDRASVAAPFLTGLRTIMIVALPCYFGLAVTAHELVAVVLGPKWIAAAPIVATLALAMPFMTMQVLFSPACDAVGRPQITLRMSMVGAITLTIGFLVGVQWGVTGLAASWLVSYPLYFALSARMVLPVIGVEMRDILAAIRAPLLGSLAMACVILVLQRQLAPLPPALDLIVHVATGGAVYAAWLIVFARPLLIDTWRLVRAR